MLPGRLMFFIWLNNLFHKKLASFDSENGNIINLSPLSSSWFSIGKNFEDNQSFIGIQDRMLPWFFEINWEKAIISPNKGKLYLSCSKNNSDIAIAINVRKKRLNVFWNKKSKTNNLKLDFRIIKVMNNGNIEVSERVYKQVELIISDNLNDVTLQPSIENKKKEEDYEDIIKSKFDNIYKDDFKNSDLIDK